MKTVILLLISVNAFATNIYRDPTCKLALFERESKNHPELINTLKSHLADKEFHTFTLDPSDRITIGTLHLEFKKTMTGGGLYPKCEISINIKKSEHTHPSINDKTIFKLSANRSFPRLTFEGTHRCKKAIRDALYALPYCKGLAN